MARENGTDGTDCWKGKIGMLFFQEGFDFFSSPTRMFEFGIQNELFESTYRFGWPDDEDIGIDP